MDAQGSLGGLARAGLALTVTVSLLASCSGGGGGGGKSAVPASLRDALAATKPVTDVTATSDAQTHVLLDEVGLRAQLGANADAVYALLDRARHKVVASEPPLDLGLFARTKAFEVGPSEPRLLTSDTSFTTILEFTEFFAASLDGLTSGKDQGTLTHDFPTSPPATSDDGTRTVTDTLSQSIGLDVAGSRITAVLHGTLVQKVVDDKTHALVAQATESRTYRGEINICPDAGGLVPLTISGQVRINTPSKTTTSDSKLDIKGHVDDQGALGSVDASYQNNSKWDAGSVDVDMGNISLGVGSGAYNTSSFGVGNATGTINTTGDAKAGIGWAMTDLALSASTAQPALKEAQRLWQHGRCVVVAVPDYGAETPLRIVDQDGVQHTEDVDTSSETKFAVTLKHRFGAPPAAPVDIALSGEDKIEPDHLDAAPGSITYTAPGEEDKTATLTLTSTSKRGIAKLLIRFATKPKKLALSMNGTVSFNGGIVTLNARISASQATFKPVGDGTYRATLPATTSYSLAISAPNCSSGSGSEGRGSLVFDATLAEGPDKQPIWKVTLDSKRSSVHTSETVCGITFTDAELSGAGGGLAGTVASAAGTMTFPADGGTVHASRNGVDATFVATVPK